ncbi:putative endo-beta-N-acetylglucosaminidase [Trypanosoma grayi]|uniref:putative endo-beta-N-acetylglucosaminidase n=1 Tax=Trypanosoma grayi TaxID=71804 RepID=UPI0004F489E4|nr:putative endo-beta-N-acetylglucosaminidase [Trypanosoma grayi]KEG10700.1 putative endo-beta-N-acetylglucosaminidase [Trypanosoma grayi]
MSLLGKGGRSRKGRAALPLTFVAVVILAVLLLVLLLLPWRDTRQLEDSAELEIRPTLPILSAPRVELGPPYDPLLQEEILNVIPDNVTHFISPVGPREGQESPHFDYGDGPSRYRNPYRPMHRTKRPCDGRLYTDGRWVYNSSRRPLYESRGKVLGCCEHGFRKEFGMDAIRRETQYEWIPNTCELFPWNEELFCRSLRGRSVMMVGDSLSDHWHASLFYLLGGKGDIYEQEGTSRQRHRCRGHPICQKYYPEREMNPIRLLFLTNQFLETGYHAFRNFLWWKDIHRYPILILNSGSWMVRPENERQHVSDRRYYALMRRAASIIRRLYKGTLIWRTSFRGHPFCWKYSKPLTVPLRPEEYNVGIYKRYRWYAIPARNAYTTALWKDMGAHILDVALMTDLMPLGHMGKYHPKYEVMNATDCLHYCSPGATYDQWSVLLMNLLLGNIVD